MKRLATPLLTLLIPLAVAAPVGAQSVTAIQARPAAVRPAVSLSYGDALKFSVYTATKAQADELRSVQIRLFRGTVQEKLDIAANARPGPSCYYYETIVMRPVVSRRGSVDTLLDFRRTLGPHWTTASGRPAAQSYTLVFEKVTSFALVAGGIKRETFAIHPATHNAYFAAAVDLAIDPGTLTAASIVTAGGAPELRPPPDCPAAMVDPREIQIAAVQPMPLRQPDRVIASAGRMARRRR